MSPAITPRKREKVRVAFWNPAVEKGGDVAIWLHGEQRKLHEGGEEANNMHEGRWRRGRWDLERKLSM